MVQLDESHFRDMHTFRIEWQPGEDGYVHWYSDSKFRFGIEQEGLDPYHTSIPREPSYIIFNTAISTSWGFPPTPLGCSEFDCKTVEGRCGFNPQFCSSLPAQFKIDHVRVYQNKADPNMSVGCNPQSHPTSRYIAAHPEKYIKIDQIQPLLEVVAGGGRCKSDGECGEGACNAFYRCSCREDWTGPSCLVIYLILTSTHLMITSTHSLSCVYVGAEVLQRLPGLGSAGLGGADSPLDALLSAGLRGDVRLASALCSGVQAAAPALGLHLSGRQTIGELALTDCLTCMHVTYL